MPTKFTKYELCMIASVVGNRAIDVRDHTLKANYTDPNVKRADEHYVQELKALSAKADLMYKEQS